MHKKLEFGEKGYIRVFGIFLVHGKGQGDQSQWSDPYPAGD